MIMNKKILEGRTFGDVLLVPQYSEVIPRDVNIESKLTKNIKLKLPILSAAMDTVTEDKMAIAMALNGGIGIIHKNLTIEKQASMVKAVKTFKVDKIKYPDASLDANGKLVVGAAISMADNVLDRVDAVFKAGADVVSLDSAHGDSYNVISKVKIIKQKYPDLDLIAGNIATTAAAKHLIKAGADALKVGIGPGSICTTRIVSGVGVPQLTAIKQVCKYAKRKNIPVIADGGIKYSGDIVKALAVGADCVMLGGMLAATEQAPGKIITIDGKKFKAYVGMGSLIAMNRGSSDRYFQNNQDSKKFVPEGVEACLAYKGDVSNILYQLAGGIRSGMGYCGAKYIPQLQRKAKFVSISISGYNESHVHDLDIVKEAPNYKGK